MDIDKTTRVVSESLARSVNRRGFLKRAGQSAFFTLAALASGHMFSGSASAGIGKGDKTTPKAKIQDTIYCSPPRGAYCSRDSANEPTGCHGAQCHSYVYNGALLSCDRDYQYYPGTGCWSTRTSTGYWMCCDCKCRLSANNFIGCGCAQFSTTPVRGVDGGGEK